MNKKIYVPVIILFLLLLGGIVYFMYGNNNSAKQANLSKEEETDIRRDNPLVISIEKANPFNVDINPIKDYKNPFAQN